jgi:hypothetical protein
LAGSGGAGFEGRSAAPGVRGGEVTGTAVGAVDRAAADGGVTKGEPGKTGVRDDTGEAGDAAAGDDDGRPGDAGVATLEPTAACTANAAPPRTPATPSPTTAFVIQDPRIQPVQPGKGATR